MATLQNGQRSILLIGASSLDSGSSHLESVWLATYLPSDKTIQLFPVFPSGKKQLSDLEKQLDLAFSLSKKGKELSLETEFVDLLEKNNYWWSGYVIYDEASLAKIFDLLGGIDLNGKTISGHQALEEFPEVLTNSNDAYSAQISVFQSICHKLRKTGSTPELEQLFSLSGSHFLTDLDASQLKMEWETLNTENQDLTCRFPTLELSRIEP